MKNVIATLVLVLGTCVALASEIIPPDMRIPQLVREARRSGEVTTLWGVDYEQILKSDKTMTAERVLTLLKSIDPDRIRLAEHAHLATVITMLEPKEMVFTFEARESGSTKVPTHYFLIKLEEKKSNKASDATSEPAPGARSSSHQR